MVATVRCEEIANERFASLTANEVFDDVHHPHFSFAIILLRKLISSNVKTLQVWLHLQEDVESGPVPGFGKKLSAILKACLSE